MGAACLIGMWLLFWRFDEHEAFTVDAENRFKALLQQNQVALAQLHTEHAGVIARHHPHPHGPVR